MLPFVTFVAFDLETTGLNPKNDEIIEIAGVKFTLEKPNGKLVPKTLSTYCSLVKPDRFIPEQATRINNITNAMVEDAPPLRTAAREFTRFCGLSTVLVAHNAGFDSEFLARALRKKGLMLPGNPVLDSLKITKKLISESPTHKLGDLAKRLANQFQWKVEQGELHRALYDCQVLTEIFCVCLRKRFQDKDLAMDRALRSVESVHGPALRLQSYR